MSSIDLKALEQKAYHSFFEDGLVDILLGVWMISIAALMWTDNTAFIGIMPLLFLPFLRLLKKLITVPRIGVVRLGKTQKQQIVFRKRLFAVVLGVLFLLGLGLYQFTVGDSSIEPWIPNFDGRLMFGLVIGFCFAVAGILLGINRWVVHAGMVIGIFLVGYFVSWDAPLSSLIAGIGITAKGLSVLFRFLQKYPVEQMS